MLNIFVIHYTKLTARKENIETLQKMAKEYSKLDVNIEIIIDHDPETINTHSIKNLLKIEPSQDVNLSYFNRFLKELSPRNISNALKHFKAIQKCSKSKENDINLVIEDDIVYSDKFFSQIDMLIFKLKDMSWDIVYVSQPSENVLQTNTLTVTPMNINNLILPCCDGYMLNREFAKELMTDFFPIRFEFNIQLSFVMNKIDSKKIYKCYPNLTGDGSKTGKYLSSIQVNNVLIFNEDYKFVYSILESDNLTDENIQKINKIMSTKNALSNADFVHLNGLYNMKIKKYDESKKLFEQAIQMYETNGIEIDNRSSLLKNRILLEKFNQSDSLHL